MFCAGSAAALACSQATRTVPVVFITVSEPVSQGIVSSFRVPAVI